MFREITLFFHNEVSKVRDQSVVDVSPADFGARGAKRDGAVLHSKRRVCALEDWNDKGLFSEMGKVAFS